MAMRKIDWDPILAEYQTGQCSISKLAKKYEVSKSTLSMKVKELDDEVTERAKSVIRGFEDSIEQLSNMKAEHPAVAEKIVDIVTQKHPEFKKAMVALSSKLFNRMLKIADEATANEIPQLAKGMQTITDTLGISQRHASNQVNVQTNTNISPQVIERRIIDAKNPHD